MKNIPTDRTFKTEPTIAPIYHVSSDQIDMAKEVYDGLIGLYLKERGWVEGEDSLWSKGDRYLLTNEEAYWAEKEHELERS